jgi:tyrosinase
VHILLSVDEAHGDRAFLPWHRAYLLDFERELQAIDPSVSLPYWNPYNPAPKIFSRDFMGATPQGFVASNVAFSATNPLRTWRVDSVDGILRSSTFNNQMGVPVILSEGLTLQLGGNPAQYRPFRQDMEINPHGDTHTSMRGSVSSLGTAAMDPLFFMLHANVDRIWAKWQFLFDRFDNTRVESYGPLNPPRRIGHNLHDTMWPWNLVTGDPRPNQAPGGAFPPSPVTSAPGTTPKVSALIDYQGAISLADRLGFDYDDVPFEFATN